MPDWPRTSNSEINQIYKNLHQRTYKNLQEPSGLREFAGEDVEEAGYRAGEQQQVAQLELDDQGDQSDAVEQAHVQHHTGALAIREHLLEQTQWLLVQFDGEVNGDRDHRADQQDVRVEVVCGVEGEVSKSHQSDDPKWKVWRNILKYFEISKNLSRRRNF